MMRRRVAIYGGAFDPPTNGHFSCCSEIIHSGLADEVWITPCGPRPDKPRMIGSAIDRMLMCQLGVNTVYTPTFPVRVCDIETYEEESLATYDTLCRLRQKHADVDFLFVVGSDWLQPGTDLRTWESRDPADPTGKGRIVTGDKLVTEFDFLVLHRPGYDIEDLSAFGPRFNMLTMAGGMKFVTTDISSTQLRKRMGNSLHIREAIGSNEVNLDLVDGLMPPAVLSFILRSGVYNQKAVQEARRRSIAAGATG